MLPVYKFFCFDGEPYIIQAIQNDKQPNESVDYFDVHWNRLLLRQNFPNSVVAPNRPKCMNDMLTIARKLSKEKDGFIRVDLYSISDHVFFSEYTFFSDSGLASFHPKKWDYMLGGKIVVQQHRHNEF